MSPAETAKAVVAWDCDVNASEPPCCVVCGGEYIIEVDEHEPTPMCHGCAHVAVHQLSEALLAERERVAKLEAVVNAFRDAVDAAERANAARGRGGQQVPFHGDFANATPSVIIALQRYEREFKTALAAGKDHNHG